MMMLLQLREKKMISDINAMGYDRIEEQSKL